MDLKEINETIQKLEETIQKIKEKLEEIVEEDNLLIFKKKLKELDALFETFDGNDNSIFEFIKEQTEYKDLKKEINNLRLEFNKNDLFVGYIYRTEFDKETITSLESSNIKTMIESFLTNNSITIENFKEKSFKEKMFKIIGAALENNKEIGLKELQAKMYYNKQQKQLTSDETSNTFVQIFINKYIKEYVKEHINMPEQIIKDMLENNLIDGFETLKGNFENLKNDLTNDLTNDEKEIIDSFITVVESMLKEKDITNTIIETQFNFEKDDLFNLLKEKGELLKEKGIDTKQIETLIEKIREQIVDNTPEIKEEISMAFNNSI